jgi:hypothetical protein
MMNKTERAPGGCSLTTPAPSTLGSVIQFPAGPTDRSVGPRVASSKAKPLEYRGLDTRSALQAISGAKLRSVDARVYAQLAAMAATKGEAWPRVVTLAAMIGVNERLVRRALRELEARGYITSRIVDVGGELPSGKRVVGNHPLRVYRVDPIRIRRSDPDRIVGSGSNRINGSGSPYEDLDPGNYCDDEDVGLSSKGSHERDGETKDDASSASSHAGPDGPAVMFTPSSTASASASSPAPDSEIVIAAVGADAPDGERMDERQASREALNEGGAPRGAPCDKRDRRRAARRVLERHAELVASIGLPIMGAVCTKTLLDVVEARMRDGFGEAELVALAAYAITSPWHLQKHTRLEARFLFRSAAEVAAVGRDAAMAAQKGVAKLAAKGRRGVPGGGGGAAVQAADPEPVCTREQMVTGTAAALAALAVKGGAR